MVLLSPLHVVEGVDDLFRRIDVLLLEIGDYDAGFISVQDLLQQDHRFLIDPSALDGQGFFHRRSPDDFSDRAFGGNFDRGFRIAYVEQEVGSVLNPPLNDEIDVDDILISGQHQAFLRYVADAGASRGASRCVSGTAIANLDRVGAVNVQFNCIPKRGREPEMQSRRRAFNVLAK